MTHKKGDKRKQKGDKTGDTRRKDKAVSYTHLTLPTKLEV